MSTPSTTMADPKAGDANGEVAWEMPVSRRGTPTWEMALSFPRQGEWTVEEYLELDTNRLVEFTDGVLEFLPMPGPAHFRISRFLTDALRSYVEPRCLGEVFWAPYSVRVGEASFREPDIGFLSPTRVPAGNTPPDGADLVMEIVSPGHSDRRRDYEKKRNEYALANIPEYWIIDPQSESITVLTLPSDENEYVEQGTFRPGQQATSVTLSGFEIDVAKCFAAGRGEST